MASWLRHKLRLVMSTLTEMKEGERLSIAVTIRGTNSAGNQMLGEHCNTVVMTFNNALES